MIILRSSIIQASGTVAECKEWIIATRGIGAWRDILRARAGHDKSWELWQWPYTPQFKRIGKLGTGPDRRRMAWELKCHRARLHGYGPRNTQHGPRNHVAYGV